MSGTITDLPLHDVILKILYHENTERAASMTPADVLWRIDNPEISERQVREVLDWLAHHKRVTLYLGKYTLDRIEFLEQKDIDQQEIATEQEQTKHGSKNKRTKTPITSRSKSKVNPPQKKRTFYLNPPKVKHSKKALYLLLFVLLGFAVLTYTLTKINYTFLSSTTLTIEKQPIYDSVAPQKKMYVSKDDTYSRSSKNAISYSFARQNAINSLTVSELNNLYAMTDSISKAHKRELISLQTELQTSVQNTNALIEKIIYANIILMLLIVFLFFKNKF